MTTIAAGKPPARRVRFLGRVRPFNIDRMFWLLALSRYEPFVEFVRSDVHAPLGNGRDEGARFADYLAELSETTGCCSLARRWNGTLTATGRTFEAVALGRVLVQEFAEEVRSFLVPEEHYLEFENLAELLEIAERIARADARLETVAQAGRAYFWNTYADHHIVRHLSHLLA